MLWMLLNEMMTNSRDMAEQAFTLLQNALEESESRRLDLEQRLNLHRPPASEIEAAYDSLQIELEQMRTERNLWKKTSNQLQDVVSNERSKAKRLSRKLGVVESGADRVTRKEVNFWREKGAEFEAAKQEFQRRIHELRQQLEQREEQDEAQQSNEVISQELASLRELLETRDASVAELSASLEVSKLQADTQDHRIAELDAEVRRLSVQVIDAELKDSRAQAATHQQALEAAQHQAQRHASLNEEFQLRIDELETQHEREIAALREEHEKEAAAFDEQHQQVLAQAQAQTQAHADTQADMQALETANAQHEGRIAELTEQLDTQTAAIAELEQRNGALSGSIEELQSANDSFSERMPLLEGELAEERHRGDNLNELANERREALGKTTEKLEEMVERYEDANWQLGKAGHFERLVVRRRKLIANLIATLRARQKANTTLKAGLDSLRRYKANADDRQQELLRRIESLENSLSETREKLTLSTQSRRASDPAPMDSTAAGLDRQTSVPRASDGLDSSELHSQVAAQAEVIENLETDLRSARLAESEARAKLRDLEKLQEDIETKSTFIDSLQKDLDEQQSTLAKLRKLEIEVRELRSYIETQDGRMAALQKENKKLRGAKNGEIDAIDKERIEEQQQLIERLSTKLREYEDTITTLSEAVDSWKRRYDFLSGETPYGFESATSTGSE